MVNVQLDIDGELAVLAVGAQVVGAQHFRVAYRRKDQFGAQLPVVRLMAAGARNIPLVGRWDWELQQFCQRCGAGLVHGRAYGHLHGFQV